jgi:hypothetical protein
VNWPNWAGETVVVVATGPSAADVPLEKGKGKAKFIAVKDAWKLCPWAEYLYACDHHWWVAHKGVVEFLGQRIAFNPRTLEQWRGLGFLKVEIVKQKREFLFDKVGTIGWGGNSGFHAINLAAQFGASKIILVGFDMRIDQGKHFFGDHPYQGGPSAPNCKQWAGIIDAQAYALEDRGIEVLNCSPVSTLRAFPIMSFEEALA